MALNFSIDSLVGARTTKGPDSEEKQKKSTVDSKKEIQPESISKFSAFSPPSDRNTDSAPDTPTTLGQTASGALLGSQSWQEALIPQLQLAAVSGSPFFSGMGGCNSVDLGGGGKPPSPRGQLEDLVQRNQAFLAFHQQRHQQWMELIQQASGHSHRFLQGPSEGGHVGLFLQPYRKPKRIRTAFSPSQLLQLEDSFENNHYVVGAERRHLAQRLQLTETQVKVWFQNRRTKHKRVKTEEEAKKNPPNSSFQKLEKSANTTNTQNTPKLQHQTNNSPEKNT